MSGVLFRKLVLLLGSTVVLQQSFTLHIANCVCGAVAAISEVEVESNTGTLTSVDGRGPIDQSDATSATPTDVDSSVQKLMATFRNDFYDETVYLYWVRPEDGTYYFMMELVPGAQGMLNTFVGHQFFVSSDRAGGIRLEQFRLVGDRSDYGLGHHKRSNTDDPLSSANLVSNNPHVKLINSPTSACAVKIRSLVNSPISIWQEDKRGGLYQGSLDLGKEYTLNTYAGQEFFFTAKDDKTHIYSRAIANKNQILYVVTDPENAAPSSFLEHQQREEAFMAEYLNATGRQWRHYFGPNGPRGPPTQYMWPAEHVGQVLAANSTEAHWLCEGAEEQCRGDPLNLELEVISLEPRAYIIKNFLSDFEADEIMRIADPRMARSTVGNDDGGGGKRSSDTRTSRNAWVGRSVNYATEALYARAEQLLKIPRLDGRNTEDMQVVHYVRGQKYDAHHDWGVSGYAESRYITLLMYLTDMVSPTAGGETSFPKAAGGRGIKVHPGKGSAVLFYNLLEDGNGDDLALHAALPVNVGEKWLANFWVWDPKRN